jgi:eukaryotic-like serine/threonine-protein kinase
VGHDGAVYALDAATGQQRWKVEFNPTLAPCHSRPIIANGTVFLTAIGPPAPKDPTKRGGYYLFAFDAATGAERWRFRAEAPYIHNGVCLSQPVLAGGALFATGEHRVFAIDAETGRQRWAPIELRRVQQGRVTELAASKLTAAGGLVIGATPVGLMAIDQAAGSIVWELPGTFNVDRVSLTVAGDVLYFQGSPDAKPAPKDTGTLYALDLSTRQFLWSFTRPTEVEWSFGTIAPFNGGIWVDTYKALLKLE